MKRGKEQHAGEDERLGFYRMGDCVSLLWCCCCWWVQPSITRSTATRVVARELTTTATTRQ